MLRDVIAYLEELGIGYDCVNSAAACGQFQIMVNEDRLVAAAILGKHSTLQRCSVVYIKYVDVDIIYYVFIYNL